MMGVVVIDRVGVLSEIEHHTHLMNCCNKLEEAQRMTVSIKAHRDLERNLLSCHLTLLTRRCHRNL